MSSSNKKSPRSFQCRERLWSTFEEMAGELECSVDYLINDAMKQYARQRGYTNEHSQAGAKVTTVSSPTSGATPPPAPQSPAASSGSVAQPLPIPATSSGSVARPLPPSSMAPPRPPTGAPPPVPSRGPPPPAPSATSIPPARTNAPGPPPIPGAAPGTPGRAPQLTVPLSPSRLPPMPPRGTPSAAAPGAPLAPQQAPSMGQALVVHYQGRAHQVAKDRFIIGRGKTSSDLTIRDPNVSRQHALIEFSGGNFYMVDMGSTNGVEFNGHRVQRKAIQNGDVFRVCDHELFCSLN